MVFKYSSSGKRIWAHKANGVMTWGWANTLDLDGKGNVVFGGLIRGNQFVLRKLDPKGQVLWSRVGGAVDAKWTLSVQGDPNGAAPSVEKDFAHTLMPALLYFVRNHA